MKKKKLLFISTLMVAVVTYGQSTDTSVVITYNLGESLKAFFLNNLWAIGFGILYFVSEYIGESKKYPEGSFVRRMVNIALNFLKKKATESPKMKAFRKPAFRTLKVLMIALIMSGLSIGASAQKKSYRWYPFGKQTELKADLKGDLPVYSKDSTLYFSPAVSFDIYTRGMTSNKNSIGAIPGIGYNLIYNPFVWEKNYLVGLGLFASAQQDNDSPDVFTFELTPVISLLNWIKIGYGHQWNFGGQNEWVMRIGIVKSL
jgi:hypothetical protein